MPLSKGDRLGPYEILEAIGKGGMGEVFRARDTRLNRDVAVKVSSEHFSERFEREAKAIASLNHPNICTLHDVGPNYLVMELVEGPTLAERIREGAIPLDEALKIAKQIGDALEAAHDKGIVHRDLKPGNVKIKPDGTVKVLDFGLAKMNAPATESENSPTLTMGETKAGVILGTAAYMAPEQARGKQVDKRADIWAFGVVLNEMVTGQRLFKGDDLTETLAAVIKEEPKLERVPARVRRVLRSCLEKDPKQRLQAIGDWRLLLDETSQAESQIPRVRLPWAVAAVFVLALAALAFVHFRETTPAPQQFRYTLPGPDKMLLENFTLSPDGRYIVMDVSGESSRQLYVRALDSLQTQALAGTENARFPFWSADSREIAFFADGKLKKVSVIGGPVQTLCDVVAGRGGTWNQDGVILFSDNGVSLHRVPAAGGTPMAVGKEEGDQRFPAFLPDGTRYLYTAQGSGSQSGIHAASLDGSIDPNRPPLLADISNASYAASVEGGRLGHVLFVRQGTLMALPVDPKTLSAAGDVFPVAEQVAGSGTTADNLFSLSRNGILTYRTGLAVTPSELTWFDRQGRKLGPVGERGPYTFLQLSPDATRAAVLQNDDIWVVDLTRGTSTRLTSDRSASQPLWSGDGSKLVYGSSHGGQGAYGIYRRDATGVGTDELLYKTGRNVNLLHWSADGRFLTYNITGTIWVLPLTGENALKPRAIVDRGFNAIAARFSPDSKFVAYRSDDTGKNEIYVEVFDATAKGGDGKAATGGRWMVSKGSLGMPRWRQDGKELYFLSADGQVMAVSITTTPTFRAGEPIALFRIPPNFLGRTATPGTLADTASDGKRFLFVMPASNLRREEVTVVLNWQAGLKK